MGTAMGYGPSDDTESIAAIRRAHELGTTHFDTAEMYGWGQGDKLLGTALAPIRDEVTIATKFGFTPTFSPNSQLDHIGEVVDNSLRNLDVDSIDLLYQHVADPQVPVEEVVGVMKEYVEAGKVKYLGLSNTDAASIRKAHAVHPISVLQTEYSIFAREAEALLPVVEELTAFATSKGASLSQLALAWLLDQKDYIVPIPGSRNPGRVAQNIAATELVLTDADLAHIAELVPKGGVDRRA